MLFRSNCLIISFCVSIILLKIVSVSLFSTGTIERLVTLFTFGWCSSCILSAIVARSSNETVFVAAKILLVSLGNDLRKYSFSSCGFYVDVMLGWIVSSLFWSFFSISDGLRSPNRGCLCRSPRFVCC